MTIIAKVPISTGNGKGGKIVVPKGTKGICKAISNSPSIRACFPNLEHKPDGWYYICCFPGLLEETLCSLAQIELQA